MEVREYKIGRYLRNRLNKSTGYLIFNASRMEDLIPHGFKYTGMEIFGCFYDYAPLGLFTDETFTSTANNALYISKNQPFGASETKHEIIRYCFRS